MPNQKPQTRRQRPGEPEKASPNSRTFDPRRKQEKKANDEEKGLRQEFVPAASLRSRKDFTKPLPSETDIAELQDDPGSAEKARLGGVLTDFP